MLATTLHRAWLAARAKRCLEAGNIRGAESLAQKLITRYPGCREGYLYLYDALFDAGRFGDSLDIAVQAITNGLNDSEIWNRKGLACLRLNQQEAAEEAFLRAIELGSPSPAPRINLSSLALRRDDFTSAKSLLDQVLDIHPDHAAALTNRALVHVALGHREAAEQDLRRVLVRQPENITALTNLVQLLIDTERLDDASTLAWNGLEHSPNDPRLLLSVGRIALLQGSFAEAGQIIQRLEKLRPSDIDIRLGLAVLLRDTKHYDEAEQLFRQLLQERHADPLVHFNYSFLLLLCGRFEEGWREYEYRKLTDESPGSIGPAPQWQGEPLEGKLLVYGEQGIGDEIMFASCIPDVLERISACVVQCDPRLASLLQRSFPQTSVVGSSRAQRERATSALGPFAAQAPMGSLPALFRRSQTSFPHRQSYLRPDPEATAQFRQQLETLGAKRKIGLCWQGGLLKTRRASRSIGLGQLVDALPDGVLVSLQHGDAAKHVENLLGEKGRHVHQLADPHNDLDQLASLIAALDVVVSIQSSVVHLSGALGARCYALLPHSPEWRYLAEGETMPWYSSVTLLRQMIPGDWSAPLQQLRQRLS